MRQAHLTVERYLWSICWRSLVGLMVGRYTNLVTVRFSLTKVTSLFAGTYQQNIGGSHNSIVIGYSFTKLIKLSVAWIIICANKSVCTLVLWLSGKFSVKPGKVET